MRAVIVAITSRRTNGHHRLKEDNVALGFTQNIDCLARVVGVLLLLNRDHPENGVDVLVVECKVGNHVVLVVVQQNIVSVPFDGWWWVSLDMALEVHVELEGLAQPLSGDVDHGRELHLHVNVSSSSLAYHVGGYAVVSSSVFLLH